MGESQMTSGALRAWGASEGASISVGFVFCVCMSCGCQEVRGESRDSPLGESQDSPHNTTHMHYHYRIFKDFWAHPPARTLNAHFRDTIDTIMEKCIIDPRHTSLPPVKTQAVDVRR